jgi:2-polyprenyl-3-methyl-5-hydroxy-6-metoxy-1,4-benzoquinol methylase
VKKPYQDKLDPWSSHTLIFQELIKLEPGTRILDVGTASGIIGRMCAGRGYVINGIEQDQEWAEMARPYYDQIMVGDIETFQGEFIGSYDVVICADVLEHLVKPLRVLKHLIRNQLDHTAYFISVPNVANLWVRLNLLFGRFDYTERGILDKTHLHFYTRSSFQNFLNEAGLQIHSLKVTPIPMNLIHPFFGETGPGRLLHGSLAGLTRITPTLLGYQFIAKANRPGPHR